MSDYTCSCDGCKDDCPKNIKWHNPPKEEFKKFDSNKPDYSLLELKNLEDVIHVLQLGANKYGRDNWKKAKDTNRYVSALMRHLSEYQSGNIIDSESYKNHMAHIICNAMFILYLDNKKEE